MNKKGFKEFNIINNKINISKIRQTLPFMHEAAGTDEMRLNMLKETRFEKNTSSPQYYIINQSEPQYELIKTQLLGPSSHPIGSSHYFIRAGRDNACVCRIKAGNGTVLFYEILNHRQEGITDDDIREAVCRPSGASPLPGYFYITPEIQEKLERCASLRHP
jgi:hypothetical protein